MVVPRALLQSRSLKFWIMAGMLLALAPVVIAAVLGFVLFNQGVIASFQDIADRQRTEIMPAQRTSLLLWDAAISVDEFVEEASNVHQASFRADKTAIAAEFAGLIASTTADVVTNALATSAQDDWKTAEALGTELTAGEHHSDPVAVGEAMDRFDSSIRSAADKLASLIERLEDDVADDQARADLTYERALWLAGIAGGVCLVTVIAGVLLIGRVMAASVDRLVDGAIRFAEGDRQHRIEVRIPPELRRVANEFNRMIIKIHAYEDLLSDRALTDVLTGLPNRRAFDETMARNWDRVQFGQSFGLVLIDIDHFKRVNDTYGHAAGDEVLRRVAEAISRQLRATSLVFRTGGEEFAVVIPTSGAEEARTIAERLRAAIPATAITLPEGELRVTISLGVTDTKGAGDAGEMLRSADTALYRAKSLGRDRVVVATDDGMLGENAA